ncbi:MAG: hypothetical protein HY286_02560 [Planctomycetes bacterium]|nr:hypothetical protein [Planctomycetota bacterium]
MNVKNSLVFLVVAILTFVTHAADFLHPLGLEDSNRALARAVCAARNFETRGFLASGGLPVVTPLPAGVAEGLSPGDPPLLSWVIYSIHAATGLDFPAAARVSECLFIVAAAFGIFTIILRRAGAAPAFVGAAFIIFCPMVAGAAGSEVLAGFACAACLASALDAFVLKSTPLAAAAMAVSGAFGAAADYRFCIDASVVAAVGILYLRKDAFRPGAIVALSSPLILAAGMLAVGERLAGVYTHLQSTHYILSGGAPLETGADLYFGDWLILALGHVVRDCLPIPAVVGICIVCWYIPANLSKCPGVAALFVTSVACTAFGWIGAMSVPSWEIRWAGTVGAGCAIAVGFWIPRWRYGGVLLALLFLILLLGSANLSEPKGARYLEDLGRAARVRVAYGESFATSETQGEIVMALAQRPVIANVSDRVRGMMLLERADMAVHPCRYFISVDPMYIKDHDDYLARRNLLDDLAAHGPVVGEGFVKIYDFGPPRPESRAAVFAELPVVYRNKENAAEFAFPELAGVEKWNIEIGAHSLEFSRAERVSAKETKVALDSAPRSAWKAYVQPTPVFASGRRGPAMRESFLSTRPMRNLASKSILFLPFGAGLLALLALFGASGWKKT